MVPVPGSLLLVVAGLPLLAARLRGAAARV
jgi:hypothetical protein